MTAIDSPGARVHRSSVATVATDQRVPFNSSSVYNRSLTDIYGVASNSLLPIHPDSDQMIEGLRGAFNFDSPGNAAVGRNYRFTADTSQFTLPVWVATDSTPIASVAWDGRWGEYTESSGTIDSSSGVKSVPIDPTWKTPPPYWPSDAGADAQFIVIKPSTGDIWDMWRVTTDASGNLVTDGSGRYTVVNGSHFSGGWDSNGVPGAEYVSRGAGVPYIVGLVRKWELDAAVAAGAGLGHALAFSFSSPSPRHVIPATKSDGAGLYATDVTAGYPYETPEGTIITLDPDYDYSHLSANAQVFARTLIDKGGYCIDNAGRPKMYVEADVSAGWSPAPGVEVVAGIPLEAFRVLDFTGGDTGRTTGTSGYGTGTNTFSAGLTGGIAGTPAVLETQVGTAVSGTTVASASQSPAASELLISIVAARGTRDGYVTAISGNGSSASGLGSVVTAWSANGYRSYIKRGITEQNGNGWIEVFVARAGSSPTAGAVTATPLTAPSASNPTVIKTLRLTASARPIRVATRGVGASADTNASTEAVKLKNTVSGNLMLGIVLQRLGSVSLVAGSWAAVGSQVVAGTSSNIVGLSAYTFTSPGGDVSFNPTLSTSTEWELILMEIT